MIQTETQRQFYLGSAGIRLWYAREPLPGAAPSPEFIFPKPDELEREPSTGSVTLPVDSAAARVPAHRSSANKKGAQRIAGLQALMEDKPESAGDSPVQSAAPAGILPSGAPENAKELPPDVAVPAIEAFKVGVFFGSTHVLVSDISGEASLRLQETLAANILKSLGEVQLKPTALVSWPVFNNRLVPGNSLSDLSAVMHHLLRDLDGHKVIFLGGSQGGANASWLFEVLGGAPDVQMEYSLAALASNSSLKRSLWEQLKPLVQK